MMYLCSVVSELSNVWQVSVGVFLHIDSGVILIGDAIQANQCLVLAEIKGVRYLISNWIVGK